MKVISVVGARPQFVKLAPIAHAAATAGMEHVIVHTLERVFTAVGVRIDPVAAARRPGDSPHVTASVERIRRLLGWRAPRTVEEMVASASAAHRAKVAA